jgi:integrase/recombinase XerD
MMSNKPENNLPMRDNSSYRVKNSMEHCPPQLQPVQQANSDEQLIELWLHGRSTHTQRAYQKDIADFLRYVGTPLRNMTLGQLQCYTDHLHEKNLSPASIKRKIASIKSLFTFSHKIGYLMFDVGKPLKTPACRDKLAERILSEEEVQTIISSVKNKRNRLIIKTLYYTGIRVSELASLTWKDLQTRTEGGQLTVLGKGGKTNTVLIPAHLWDELMTLGMSISDDNPVFMSRNGRHLHPGHIRKTVKKIAIKAISKGATPHYYRHSAASHAILNGCPLHLIQKQLNHASIATTGKYLHSLPTQSIAEYLK